MEEETFYDSLEDASDDDDISEKVPLYVGETPKKKITRKLPKKLKPPPKPFIPIASKKSYLSIYYEKIKKLGFGDIKASSTNTAVCGSPPREPLETSISSCNCGTAVSEPDNFYQDIMKASVSTPELLNRNKPAVVPNRKLKAFSLKVDESKAKAELVKKRQEYGMKMSLKNRIEIEENKALRKIKFTAKSKK